MTLRALAFVAVVAAALTLAPAVEGAIFSYVPDLLTPERDHTGTQWTHDREGGPHLAFHFSPHLHNEPSAIVRLVDADGEDLMHAYVTTAVYISDGYDDHGAPRYIEASWVASGWNRADIVLNGTTYTYQDDSDHPDGGPPVEARLFKETTAGAFADPSTVLESGRVAQVERERIYGPETRFTTFRESLGEQDDWVAYAPDGQVEVEEDQSYMGHDRLRIEADPSLEGLTYLHTPAPDDAHVAEASFRPRTASRIAVDGVPDHQAVLAGVSGPLETPEVDWAVVMAPGAPDRPAPWAPHVVPPVPGEHWVWSLYFIDRDGTRTQIAPTWGPLDPLWHDVRVHVDPAIGAVEVQVDGNATALRFDDAFTGASDRIATGDVWRGDELPWWTGGRTGYYDNLAVDPVGVGT